MSFEDPRAHSHESCVLKSLSFTEACCVESGSGMINRAEPVLSFPASSLCPQSSDGGYKWECLDTVFVNNNAANIQSTIPLRHSKCFPLGAFVSCCRERLALQASQTPKSKHFQETGLGWKLPVLLDTQEHSPETLAEYGPTNSKNILSNVHQNESSTADFSLIVSVRSQPKSCSKEERCHTPVPLQLPILGTLLFLPWPPAAACNGPQCQCCPVELPRMLETFSICAIQRGSQATHDEGELGMWLLCLQIEFY